MADAPLPYTPATAIAGGDDPAPLPVVSVGEDDVLERLGQFIEAIMDVEVSQGQANRVPEPLRLDHVIMTPGSRIPLSTTQRDYPDDQDAIDVGRSMRFMVQVDVYGPKAGDNVQAFVNLFRDDYACRFFDGSGIAPIDCQDANQMPLVNGEFQYEDRWTLMAALQINPIISTPMQFADNVAATLVEADQ